MGDNEDRFHETKIRRACMTVSRIYKADMGFREAVIGSIWSVLSESFSDVDTCEGWSRELAERIADRVFDGRVS